MSPYIRRIKARFSSLNLHMAALKNIWGWIFNVKGRICQNLFEQKYFTYKPYTPWFRPYFGQILIPFWSYFIHVLIQFLSYFGRILAIFWSYFRIISVKFWSHFGHSRFNPISVTFWSDFIHVLIQFLSHSVKFRSLILAKFWLYFSYTLVLTLDKKALYVCKKWLLTYHTECFPELSIVSDSQSTDHSS